MTFPTPTSYLPILPTPQEMPVLLPGYRRPFVDISLKWIHATCHLLSWPASLIMFPNFTHRKCINTSPCTDKVQICTMRILLMQVLKWHRGRH